MKPRPDLLDDSSPTGIEVLQLTTEADVPSAHVYMEAQIFTPDSKRFLLYRGATAHGASKGCPRPGYVLCDLDDECSLHPLADEPGAIAPSVSPDGKYVYYLVDETEVGGGRLTLKRVNLDGADRRVILALDAGLPETGLYPSKIYPLSTISSDGKRLAFTAFLGDGRRPDAPYGVAVFDVQATSVELVIQGPTWSNAHAQYCRSTDAQGSRDIMIQEEHGTAHDARGRTTRGWGQVDPDIHVIRDDGTNFRDLPWGRDGNERCQGHQCWRGRSHWMITSTTTKQPAECQLIESLAVPHNGHIGIATPGGIRNDLSRTFPGPDFAHFATDIEGRRLITDCGPRDTGGRIFLGELGEPGTEAVRRWTYLLNPRTAWLEGAHAHPFLSPDGSLGFFNSDESGMMQAYMISGLDRL